MEIAVPKKTKMAHKILPSHETSKFYPRLLTENNLVDYISSQTFKLSKEVTFLAFHDQLSKVIK
ncbi:MAG: hypothetical protein M3232_01280 [Thermoproteota archaeon]|nr:hypothetical protein [Thermoproteota archaeon]